MSALVIEEVRSKKQLDDFLRMPWKIYEGDPNWVPPLLEQQYRVLDKKRNPFFEHAEMKCWLVRRGAEAVGRIAGIIDHDHLKAHKDNNGLFGFFECQDDDEACSALFNTVQDWLSENGLDGMLGPLSPSLNYESGVLVEGFDGMPRVMMAYGPPYYERLFLQAGFQPGEELLAFWFDLEKTEALRHRDLRSRTSKKFDVALQTPRFDAESLETLRQLYNSCWEENAGYVPVGKSEFQFLYDEMKAILFPEFCCVATIADKPVGFIVAMPDINPFFAKTDGTLSLLGKIRFLWQRKRMTALRVILLGVEKEYRPYGTGFLLFFEIVKRAKRAGYKGLELSWILASNPLVKPLLGTGARIYRRYRLYERKYEQHSRADKNIFANA